MLQKHPSFSIQIPSLRDSRGFWKLQGFCVKSGAVGMQVAFGQVRRKTAPIGLGLRRFFFLKLTPMGF